MIGTPAGANGSQHERDAGRERRGLARTALAQVRHAEREEQRRERRVEAEGVRIVRAPRRPPFRRRCSRPRGRRTAAPTPTRIGHSKRPRRPESAHDSSTIACDSTSRRSLPPGKIDATVTLIADVPRVEEDGRENRRSDRPTRVEHRDRRELRRARRTSSPTSTTAAALPNPVASASTPYESPKRIGLGASGSAARTPSRMREATRLAVGHVSNLRQPATRLPAARIPRESRRQRRVRAHRLGTRACASGRRARRRAARSPRADRRGRDSLGSRSRTSSTRRASRAPTRSSTSAARTSASAGPMRASARSSSRARRRPASSPGRRRRSIPARPSSSARPAIGVYGDRGDEILTEESELGSGFLADVARAWEAAADPAREAGIRVVHLRQGIVLARRRRRARADAPAVQARCRRPHRERQAVVELGRAWRTSSAPTGAH